MLYTNVFSDQSELMFQVNTFSKPIKSHIASISFWFVSGLSKQSNLTWLSLAGNQLSSLDTGILEKLPQLRYLSVENNVITYLRGLQVSALLFFF